MGEAGCLVIGPTLVVDLFSEQVRGRALSLFFLGLPLGGTAGYIIGGVITEHFGGWRNAFFMAGAPGLLSALRDLPIKDRCDQSRSAMRGARLCS